MEMNKFGRILGVAASLLWASFEGSLSQSGVKGPPSPPRNLRRSVVGLWGTKREYRTYWSASSDTGGLAVNYTVKLCVNDSLVNHTNNDCKFSRGLGCQVTNISDTNINFSCAMNIMVDFAFKFCNEFCNYTLCVVATNDVGSATSCIPAPYVEPSLVTPQPPIGFSVEVQNGDIIVRWKERAPWLAFTTVYTVIYYVLNQQTENKKLEVTNKTNFVRLHTLEPFTTYCFTLTVQFVSEGVRSAHSEVLDQRCQKTPAGVPIDPPEIVQDQSVRFPHNAKLRNVTVKWKLAKGTSWRGTPHQYRILCDNHILDQGSMSEKWEYYTDAATNSTVLQGLRTGHSYNVYVTMCNKEKKCSSRGRSYLVQKLDSPTQPSSPSPEKLSTEEMVWVAVSVVVGVVVSAFAVFCTCKWRRDESRRQFPLHKRLQIPNDLGPTHEYDYINDTNTYENLNLSVGR